jgi:beta-glucosidase
MWCWRRLMVPVAAGLVAASAATAWTEPGRPAATAAVARNPVQQAQALVAKMTLAQKIMELHGIKNSQHERYVPGIPSMGIPPLVITNGPAGVGPGDDPAQHPATALPAPISLAASFDPSLAYQYGTMIGKEAADLGNNLVQGPGVNIVRVPQGGRTFESLSEDPYLTASIGTAETQGIQAQPGMISEVKHFDAYSQETYRNTPADDNVVSVRVLHEIYDPPFQQAITKGGAAALMCSYATVNGEYSCQDPYLLSTTVDQRWGFDGFIQSDFGAVHSTVGSALAGMDLEMPAGDYYAAPMVQAVLDGKVPIATVNQMLVTRFAAMIRRGLFSHPVSTSPIPAQADAGFSLSAAEQGMVLLKDDHSQLPLAASSLHSIAVIGPYAASAMTGGGGSSHVDPLLTVSPVQGIRDVVGPDVTVTYNDGSDPATAAAAAKSADVAIVMAGDTESEGADQPSLSLSGDQNQVVAAVAATNRHTVVVVKSGNPVLMPWLNQVPAVLEAWYPGEEDGSAVAAVLFGAVNPSGKLPVTFPVSESQTPTSRPSQFPGINGKVLYSEGLDVGYRGYAAEGITPRFPFGYGLSYTTFAFSNLAVSSADVRNPASGPGASSCGCNGQGSRLATVSATVTNTGKVAGAEVAQLYVGDPAVASEPPRQLEGFDKVYLRPGQSATVMFPLTGHALSCWNDKANGWVVPDGTFQVYVGDSSALASLPLRGSLTVTRLLKAGGHPGAVWRLEPPDFLLGQPDVQRGGGVCEVVWPGRADDGRGHDEVLQDPGEGNLRHRNAALTGDRLHLVDDRLIVVRQHPPGHVVGLAAGGLLPPRPCQPALGQRAPRYAAGSLVSEEAEHLTFVLALHEAVLVLHRHELRPPVHLRGVLELRELPGPHRGGADVAGLARLDHVVQRLHGLLGRRLRVEAVDLVQVDVVGAQAGQ